MKNLFIIWRPFQLLSALSYLEGHKYLLYGQYDLIIIDDFSGSESMYEQLRSSDVFDNVYITRFNTISNFWSKLKKIIFTKQYLKSLFGKDFDMKYNRIIASGWMELVYRFYEVNRKRVELVLIDDGIGSYVGDRRHTEFPGKKQMLFSMLLNKGPYSVNVASQYLFEPEVATGDYSNLGVVKKLNLPNKDSEMWSTIHYTLGYKQDLSSKVIFLDQIWPPSRIGKKNNEIQKELLNNFIDNTQLTNVIYRLHPNNKNFNFNFPSNFTIMSSEMFWESYVDGSITNNDILISYVSSGLLTPKMIYKKEPCVIALYKLLNYQDQEEYNRIDVLFNNVKMLYNNKNKFLIPSTLEEYYRIIKEMNQSRKRNRNEDKEV